MYPAAIEEMDADALANMSAEERMALLMGEPQDAAPAAPAADPAQDPASPQGDTTAQAPPAAETPQTPAAPATTDPAAQQQRMVPYEAMVEERRRRQQMQALLDNPDQLAQHLAQRGYQVAPAGQEAPPPLQFENEEAIQAIVAQAVAPLQQQVSALDAERTAMRKQLELRDLRQEFGPEVDDWIAAIDESRPDLAQVLDARSKALMVQGILWSDPQYQQQQIDAKATAKATEQVKAALAGSQKSTPVTLSGITPAADPDALPDLESLTPDQYEALPQAKRDAMRERLYQGG